MLTWENIIGCVATWNADPYMVEYDETAIEIMNEIDEYGIEEVTDADDLADYAAKLNGDSDTYAHIYVAGGCIIGAFNDEIKEALSA